MTAALYRTRITHLRRAPVHHYFEHRSYSWFVDLDALPRLPPRWLRPFAKFDARDHLWGGTTTTPCAAASMRSSPTRESTCRAAR